MVQACVAVRRPVVVFWSVALVMGMFLLLTPAKARAFDLDGSLKACEAYKLPEQVDQRLACLNNCIDSLRSFVASQQGAYGPGTTACGVRCVDTFKIDVNACIDKAKGGASEAEADACIGSAADRAEACTGACGYPED